MMMMVDFLIFAHYLSSSQLIHSFFIFQFFVVAFGLMFLPRHETIAGQF